MVVSKYRPYMDGMGRELNNKKNHSILRSTLEDPAELQRQLEQQQHERLNEAGCLDGFKAAPKVG